MLESALTISNLKVTLDLINSIFPFNTNKYSESDQKYLSEKLHSTDCKLNDDR